MKKRFGFVYLWYDSKRKKYYLGSHLGRKDDGYVGSNKRFICAYKSRPDTFRRRILFEGYFESNKELLSIEQKWLSLIDDEELFVKYYNEKKVAAGGDIVSTLPDDRKKAHRQKSIEARKKAHQEWVKKQTPEALSERAKYARSKVVNVHKPAPLFGSENPFYGKKHSEESKEKMRQKIKERPVGNRANTYIITFPDGSKEIHVGTKSIKEKYFAEHSFNLNRFIDKNKPIASKRKTAKNNPLLGAIIEIQKEMEK